MPCLAASGLLRFVIAGRELICECVYFAALARRNTVTVAVFEEIGTIASACSASAAFEIGIED